MTRIDELLAKDIMTKSVLCARPTQTLAEAELLLIENRIGGMPVVENKILVGVLSRSDIARVQVLSQSLDGQVTDELQSDEHTDGFQHVEHAEFGGFEQRLRDLKVKDAMRYQVVTCNIDTPVTKIAADMVRQHIHRVIVVDGQRPVGIISTLDIVKIVAGVEAKV